MKSNSLKYGLIAGLIFGVLDIIPMFFMDDFADKNAAILGAFINRFAIGLLIFTTGFKNKGWLKGLLIGLLLSLPDAIITKAFGPIIGMGITGGVIIGFVDQKINQPKGLTVNILIRKFIRKILPQQTKIRVKSRSRRNERDMDRKIKWGIIGLGRIAGTFANDLLLHDKSVLYGVASREESKARKFAQKFNAVNYYGSYKELAKDPEIDVVYIATPHTLHFENTMMCLEEGKSVLCEKPMGINANQVKTMINKARSEKLFLMEAMWTRFIPATEKMLELIESKRIGDVSFIRADFGFRGDNNMESRLYNKQLGGGSLMDIGIYPLYLALLLKGMPEMVRASARMTKTGVVDTFCTMLLDWPNSGKAVLESTIEEKTPTEAYIYGEKGTLKLEFPFHHTKRISLLRNDRVVKVLDLDIKGYGYYHEIEEVTRCLMNGKTESERMPLSVSMDLMTLLDRVKKEIGLKYDADR